LYLLGLIKCIAQQNSSDWDIHEFIKANLGSTAIIRKLKYNFFNTTSLGLFKWLPRLHGIFGTSQRVYQTRDIRKTVVDIVI